MKWSFYLTKLSKIIFQITFPMMTVTSDDRDPPRINNNIKQLIQEKNDTYLKGIKFRRY